MRSISVILTAALFFLWILPLGVFIKPSQEKVACDGQRAICMCSHAKANKIVKAIEGFNIKSNPNSSKESNVSSSAGHYYLTSQNYVNQVLHISLIEDAMFVAYRNPSLKLIEHIPKA